MTRVNLVPVEELADQHLFAEWREIKMIGPSLRRSLARYLKTGASMESAALDVALSIPRAYCLGTGHVKFFYNKGQFLQHRFELLSKELDRRWFQYDRTAVLDEKGTLHTFPWNCNWTPSELEISISRARIQERIAQKPSWYRWTSAAA